MPQFNHLPAQLIHANMTIECYCIQATSIELVFLYSLATNNSAVSMGCLPGAYLPANQVKSPNCLDLSE